jgi:hypothetical protein
LKTAYSIRLLFVYYFFPIPLRFMAYSNELRERLPVSRVRAVALANSARISAAITAKASTIETTSEHGLVVTTDILPIKSRIWKAPKGIVRREPIEPSVVIRRFRADRSSPPQRAGGRAGAGQGQTQRGQGWGWGTNPSPLSYPVKRAGEHA